MLVLLERLRLEVLGHRPQLELLLREQPQVRLLHSHRLHSQCWRHMLNRSCCHKMNRSSELLRSKLELGRCSRLGLLRSMMEQERCSMMELLRSRLALACSTLRGLACTSELCT